MKPEILEMLTWRDLKEIVNTADEVIEEAERAFGSEYLYYKAVLNRLKEKNIEI